MAATHGEQKLKIEIGSKPAVWNKGQTIGQKPPLTKKEIRTIHSKLKSLNSTRDLVLFNLAIDSSLGASDLVCLRLKDIVKKGVIAQRINITSGQTRHPVQFDISETTRALIADWVTEKDLKPANYLFASRINDSPHISARQYARIISDWIRLAGLASKGYSAQSLRRTKPTLMYRQTNDLDAVMTQLGHVRVRSTVRYLGIE